MLGDHTQWTHFDGLFGFVSTDAQRLAANISHHLGLCSFPPKHRCDMIQLDSNTCATVAFAHRNQLLNPGLMVLSADIQFLHTWIPHPRGSTGSIHATVPATLSPEQRAKLTGLLAERGVPGSNVSERAEFVIQKLGASAIIAKNSWAHLKLQASNQESPFVLSFLKNLRGMLKRPQSKQYEAGISNHKANQTMDKQTPLAPQLDPSALRL